MDYSVVAACDMTVPSYVWLCICTFPYCISDAHFYKLDLTNNISAFVVYCIHLVISVQNSLWYVRSIGNCIKGGSVPHSLHWPWSVRTVWPLSGAGIRPSGRRRRAFPAGQSGLARASVQGSSGGSGRRPPLTSLVRCPEAVLVANEP